MTPLLAALSSSREACWSASRAAALSPASAAVRKRRIDVFSEDLTALFRWRAFSFVLMRLSWDRMFATKEASDAGDGVWCAGPSGSPRAPRLPRSTGTAQTERRLGAPAQPDVIGAVRAKLDNGMVTNVT